MNFKKLARCIILLWLPLASLKLYNNSNPNNYLENEDNSQTNSVVNKSEKKNLLENFKKKVETQRSSRLDSEMRVGENTENSGRASENFPNKISANLNLGKMVKSGKSKEKSAHKIGRSLKKDLSALSVINIIDKNKSAVILKRYSRGKRKSKSNKIYKREAVLQMAADEHQDLDDYDDEEFEEAEETNSTEMGSYLGAPCESTCSEKLLHVFCDPKHNVCECEEKYPVQIGVGRGCEKPKQLGDQCFYAQTCSFFDPNAVCTQINHNAICQCKPGFHTVALRKGVRRMFCSEDVEVVSADLPTLLGVVAGIAVLTGLLCFVLRLFSGSRYPQTRHYANANIPPPLLLSDNQWINGIPLTVHNRPPSRSSCQRSTMNLAQYSRNKGVMVPASRAGAARAAAILLIPCHLQASRQNDSEVIKNSNNEDADAQPNDVEQSSHLGSRRHSFSSVHSTTSSQKSMTYSARRFEQENQQREQRAAMRAAREEASRGIAPPTPSPISTDGLISISKNIEEDPLCSNTAESPPKSEPPALAITKGNTSSSTK